MSREIKFRCWSDEEGRYLRLQNVNFVDNKPNSMSYHKKGHKGFLHIRFPNFIFEQYTGLKDKNGKEIYEGDILGEEWESCYIAWCDKCKQFQVFTIYGCMACAGDVHWYEMVEDDGKLEVIGNIHENPELLGGDNE